MAKIKAVSQQTVITGFLFLLFFYGNVFLFATGAREGLDTEITSQILREYWAAGTKDKFEGIYIQYSGNNPLLLGILKNNTFNELFGLEDDEEDYGSYYFGIYLYGPGSGSWKDGYLKAVFAPVDDEGRNFAGIWYTRPDSSNDNYRISFYDDDCSFMLTIPGFLMNRTERYEKIFPYSRDFARETGSTGTGFLLNREGYVVTNFHVIEGLRHILVRGINGDFERAYPYTAVLTDRENDIAVLKPDVSFLRFGAPPYRFLINDMPVGSDVLALGYPMRASMGDEIKLTNGIISALSGFAGNPNQYQTTVSVSPGNSGGPLLNRGGDLIGINSSFHRLANNAFYAVKIKHVIELIENSELRINTPNVSRQLGLQNRSLVQITADVKNFVYMIEAY